MLGADFLCRGYLPVTETNHLGTNCPKVTKRVRQHKKINTKEGQVLYSQSSAAANQVERLRLCSAVLESVKNGLDLTPLGEWTE